MTATTPSMRAVRFETGLIELELSNRIQCKATPTGSSYLKLFGKCQVDLNLALGQIVKHQVLFFFPLALLWMCTLNWYDNYVLLPTLCPRSMRRQGLIFIRWLIFVLGLACAMLCRRRSVDALTKRLCSSHLTDQ